MDKLPGVIEDYQAEDLSGLIRLDDGRTVSFGRSACVGFEPHAQVRVGVGKLLKDATGAWTTHELTLSAHPVKDARTLPAPERAPGQAPAALFNLSVLLDRAVPPGGEALASILAVPGLERLRVLARGQGEAQAYELLLDGHHMIAQAVPTPVQPAGLDLRQVPAGFSLGAARFSLTPSVVPTLRLREMLGKELPDPFGPLGLLRATGRMVAAVLRWGGRAVALHSAGGLVFTRDDFLRRLGDLDNPQSKPFGAWVDWALEQDGNGRRYRSLGMELLGGQDVSIPIVHERSDVELDSAESAVLYACMLQVRENRLLEDGEVLYVPKDVRVGPLGASAKEKTGYKYTALQQGGAVVLERC